MRKSCSSKRLPEDFDRLSFHQELIFVGLSRGLVILTSSWTRKLQNRRKNLQVKGFAAALAVLVTGASQSRQHESRKPPTKSLFDVGSRRISIVTVNTKEYHSDVLAIITRIMRRTF
ncbi:hypothetical protein Tco_0079183 [Tanacetum coccineum]